MKTLRLTILCILLGASSYGQKLAEPILLWPSGAPGATGTSDEDKPALIPFIPDPAKRNGAAVLVVPGGGFTIRAVDHEGILVAQWLKDHGITAFILRYRLRPLYGRNDWVKDGQRGMQYIRAHAADYNISVNRIGTIGFSAGANLIGDLSFNAIPGQPNASDPLDKFPTRPDFLILGYGSFQIPATADSAKIAGLPPTFMYGTEEDGGVLRGMVEMYGRLFKAGTPVESHFFQNGIHGSGFAMGDPTLGEWPKLLLHWFTVNGFLTDKQQVSLSGVVKLDGTALLKGMVILTPVNNPEAPPVVVYMNNTGTGELGRFTVPKKQGPIVGKYKVEVRQDATRWTSNSRDPFMISMMTKQRDRTLTEEDLKAWGDFLRKRDLSPSITNQRVFSRKHPSDKSDYVIDVEEGKEVLIEVFSK